MRDIEEGTYRYHGRDFSREEIAWIRCLIETKPTLNRVQLSRLVCDELGWFKLDGGRKDMACRVAMLRMERDELIVLPPPRKGNGNGRTRPKITTATDPRLPFSGCAGHLGALEFEQIRKGRFSGLWNEFIERYHYLGYKPLTGAQMRYFVHAGSDLVALLGFGAAAWVLRWRDEFVGWTREQREKGLHLITNNARFLILPWIQSKNLASRILGRAARQLPGDWEERYGYRPVLLETHVEHGRFKGTCYRAANWQHIGKTQGRGKLDTTHANAVPVKDIFVYPLTKNFREQLRGGHCEAVDSDNHRTEEHDGRRQPRSDSCRNPGGIL